MIDFAGDSPSPNEEHPNALDAAAIEALREQFPAFIEDLLGYVILHKNWRQATEPRLVPNQKDIPSDFTWRTNTDFEPYNDSLHVDFELQRRGSPLLICREARVPAHDGEEGAVMEGDVSIYVAEGTPSYGFVNDVTHNEPYWFTHQVKQGQLGSFYLETSNKGALPIDESGPAWADKNGLLIPGFMASTIIRYAERGKLATGRERYADLRLYEQFAAEADEQGTRKFRPLSMGQVAGLAINAAAQHFIENPELNQAYGLVQPFVPVNGESTLE